MEEKKLTTRQREAILKKIPKMPRATLIEKATEWFNSSQGIVPQDSVDMALYVEKVEAKRIRYKEMYDKLNVQRKKIQYDRFKIDQYLYMKHQVLLRAYRKGVRAQKYKYKKSKEASDDRRYRVKPSIEPFTWVVSCFLQFCYDTSLRPYEALILMILNESDWVEYKEIRKKYQNNSTMNRSINFLVSQKLAGLRSKSTYYLTYDGKKAIQILESRLSKLRPKDDEE